MEEEKERHKKGLWYYWGWGMGQSSGWSGNLNNMINIKWKTITLLYLIKSVINQNVA